MFDDYDEELLINIACWALGIFFVIVILFFCNLFITDITKEPEKKVKDLVVEDIGYIKGENFENEVIQSVNITDQSVIENIIRYFNSYNYSVEKDIPIQEIKEETVSKNYNSSIEKDILVQEVLYKVTMFDMSNNNLREYYILKDYNSYTTIFKKAEDGQIEEMCIYFSDEEIDIIPIEKYLGFSKVKG